MNSSSARLPPPASSRVVRAGSSIARSSGGCPRARGASAVLPAHSGKFALARHTWDAPYRDLSALSEGRSYALLTPEIGEALYIGREQSFSRWWENMS